MLMVTAVCQAIISCRRTRMMRTAGAVGSDGWSARYAWYPSTLSSRITISYASRGLLDLSSFFQASTDRASDPGCALSSRPLSRAWACPCRPGPGRMRTQLSGRSSHGICIGSVALLTASLTRLSACSIGKPGSCPTSTSAVVNGLFPLSPSTASAPGAVE